MFQELFCRGFCFKKKVLRAFETSETNNPATRCHMPRHLNPFPSNTVSGRAINDSSVEKCFVFSPTKHYYIFRSATCFGLAYRPSSGNTTFQNTCHSLHPPPSHVITSHMTQQIRSRFLFWMFRAVQLAKEFST